MRFSGLKYHPYIANENGGFQNIENGCFLPCLWKRLWMDCADSLHSWKMPGRRNRHHIRTDSKFTCPDVGALGFCPQYPQLLLLLLNLKSINIMLESKR
jgi:hypothetical protein